MATTTRSKKRTRDESPEMFSLDLATDDDIEDWNEWVAATQTRNYVLEDGILDVLKTKASTLTRVNKAYQHKFVKTIGADTSKTFVTAIMNQGVKFEKKVFELLVDKFGETNITNIGGDSNPRSQEKFFQTVQEMKSGTPIIYQGVLRNYSNKTYGIPDLIVRSDWLGKIVETNPLSKKQQKIRAKKLFTKKNRKESYHYVVIDIKFKTLNLMADGIHLRNDGPIKAYKAQLCVYNEALGLIQGYEPEQAYILGWKWKYTVKTVEYRGNNCFDRLGVINYCDRDKDYVQKTEEAIEWINLVRQESDKWDLSQIPLPHEQLYPNMCNRYDFPYHNVKKKFANDIDEISLIWKCGPKQRKIAHENGIYSWKDKRLTAEMMGIGGEYTSNIVERILEANHSDEQYIYPKYITNNWGDWKNKNSLELFVDFEMTCGVLSEFEDLSNSGGESVIFMIGVGYICPDTGDWIFEHFTSSRLDRKQEYKICSEFMEYVNQLSYQYDCFEPPKMYHWSHAEPSTWNKTCLYHDMAKWMDLNWVDMLKVFQSEPIGIKGCLNYSLKTVAKTFYKLGLIKTIWDGKSICGDGADAAYWAYRVDQKTKKQNKPFTSDSAAQDIIKYNEVDCKVLWEILYYLRNNHIDPDDLDMDMDLDIENMDRGDIENMDTEDPEREIGVLDFYKDWDTFNRYVYLCNNCDLLYDTDDDCDRCGKNLFNIDCKTLYYCEECEIGTPYGIICPNCEEDFIQIL